MLISVIIPVFNTDISLLERSVKSVLITDSKEIEVVVVDDGSSEMNSSEYLRLCGTDLRIRYIKKTNGEPSSARNLGIDTAKGEYIMFLDSDDYLTRNCIGEAMEICKKIRPDIIMGYVKKLTGGG